MTNIVPLDKSRGFTRMDNQLMDGLLAIDLPAREMKIVLYVAKATINFGAGAQRLPATDIAKAINVHPDSVSKAVSSLLRRRVLFREGGARGDIGLNDPKDWVYVIEPKQTKTADSAEVVRIGSESKQTKTADSLLYSKKETPYENLPSEDVSSPPEGSVEGNLEPEPKPDRKPPFGLTQLMADNPHQIPRQLLIDWLALRKAKRAAVSETVWATVNDELAKCAEAGLTAVTAITEALSAGWQGFKADWVINRVNDSRRKVAPAKSNHHGFSGRDYTDGLIPREDGSYAF
ncbi:replication protein [Pseudomonas putida]|uniref:replication protein n=1 Tax=Pseudomonas TaxID=286 RepID=UPI000BA2BEAB|nr:MULTISPECIES: replication protein [Pseudomonas]EKT4562772.1 replication protein [Pseudomonas putida]MBH3471098.1 replication protein [Pseudomonas putida]